MASNVPAGSYSNTDLGPKDQKTKGGPGIAKYGKSPHTHNTTPHTVERANITRARAGKSKARGIGR